MTQIVRGISFAADCQDVMQIRVKHMISSLGYRRNPIADVFNMRNMFSR